MSGSQFDVEGLLQGAMGGNLPSEPSQRNVPLPRAPSQQQFDVEGLLSRAKEGTVPDPQVLATIPARGGTPDLPAWAGGGPQPQAQSPAAQPHLQTPGQMAQDVASAIPSGLYKGVSGVFNIPTSAANLAQRVMHGMTGQNFGQPLQPPIETNPTGYQPGSGLASNVQNAAEAVGNVAMLGGVGRALLPFTQAGTPMATVAGALANTGPGTLAAAAAGGAAQEPAAGMVPEEYKPLARLGANIGAGTIAGGAGGLLGGIDLETARLGQLAVQRYGLPIRAGQLTNNRIVRQLDSTLKSVPGAGYGNVDDALQSAWQRQVIATMGGTGDNLNESVFNEGRRRIGSGLNEIEARTPVQLDNPFVNRVAQIENEANTNLMEPEKNRINGLIGGLFENLRPDGTIAGKTFGNLLHRGSPLATATLPSAPVNVRNFASQLQGALRDALERSAQGDDATQYTRLRTQWKNMETLRPLVRRADQIGGITPSTGGIKPSDLLGVVAQKYGDMAISQAKPGQIPLLDLARIGQRFMKELPTSQTAERTQMRKYIEAAGGGVTGALLGVGAEHAAQLGPHALMGAAAGGAGTALAGRLIGAGLRSRGLANQAIQNSLGQSNIGQNIGRVTVPLATAQGVRELEPPGPSVNPRTAQPEFSLEANQSSGKRQIADQIAGQIANGGLADDKAIAGFLRDNKPTIRTAFGGQGMQNIQFVAALVRRGGNLLSAMMQNVPPAIQSAGVNGPADMISLAMTSPELAKMLAMKSTGAITPATQKRVVGAIQKANNPDAPLGNPLSGRRAIRGGVSDGLALEQAGQAARAQGVGTPQNRGISP